MSSMPWSLRRHRRSALSAVMLLVVVGSLIAGLAGVSAAPGDSRSEPAPLNTETQAGPWRLTVLQALTGDEATASVTGSGVNPGPADGLTYVAVQIRAVNGGDRSLAIDGNDFAVTGASGVVRRFADVVAPDPALDGIVEAGATREGWIVGEAAADEEDLLLLFDSLTLTGNWADRVFALQDGATVASADSRPVKLNETGREADAPAGLNEPMATRDWVVEVLEVVTGDDVYNLYPEGDYRTTALADSQNGEDIPYWVAFRVRVTNNRNDGTEAYLSPTAFMLADGNGDPVADVLTLSPPEPDASGAYFPGAAREGWVAFEQPIDYPGALVRFLPFQTDTDPRYFTWDPDAAAAASEPTEAPEPITEGSTVVTIEEGVRLRAEPSTSAEIVAELPAGTELTVTGPAGDADGLSWYPVENPETGDSGYVAVDFVRAA